MARRINRLELAMNILGWPLSVVEAALVICDAVYFGRTSRKAWRTMQ